ncbi:hypothetical protein C4587_00585 [Candidatus Parcubacteria bacterium]|nr:MAG: hypothetical protein C4587_00585 [Candidatus Parcubacteria bacterium]
MAFKELEWQAPEFEYREKNVAWYWISIIIAAVVLGAAVWQGNFLFGFFVVLAEILVLVWASREPRTVRFALTDKGIGIDKQAVRPYDQISHFTVSEGGPEWMLLKVSFRRRVRPDVAVRVPRDKIEDIVKLLASFAPQREAEDSLLDALEQWSRF